MTPADYKHRIDVTGLSYIISYIPLLYHHPPYIIILILF